MKRKDPEHGDGWYWVKEKPGSEPVPRKLKFNRGHWIVQGLEYRPTALSREVFIGDRIEDQKANIDDINKVMKRGDIS